MKLMIAALAVAYCSFATHADVIDVDEASTIATDFLSHKMLIY